jgi:hypothetical protein
MLRVYLPGAGIVAGIGALPFASCQRMAFSFLASLASGLGKFIRDDSFAPAAFFRSMVFARPV